MCLFVIQISINVCLGRADENACYFGQIKNGGKNIEDDQEKVPPAFFTS